MGKKPKKSIFHKWSNSERWERASFVANKLIDHVADLIHINASNEWVVYGPIAQQIPHSYAANTFNRFRRAVHHYELIRLTAIWDDATKKDRVSFPTLIALLDFPEAEAMLKHAVFIHWAGPGSSEDEEAANTLRKMILHRANEMRDAAPRQMKDLISQCETITQSDQLKALRGFRNQYIAHNLDYSDHDTNDLLKPKNKDETDLLLASIPIAADFHQLINGAGFAFDISIEHARKNASELWEKVEFNIIDRSKKPLKATLD